MPEAFFLPGLVLVLALLAVITGSGRLATAHATLHPAVLHATVTGRHLGVPFGHAGMVGFHIAVIALHSLHATLHAAMLVLSLGAGWTLLAFARRTALVLAVAVGIGCHTGGCEDGSHAYCDEIAFHGWFLSKR
jgi:hypothetical protein